MHRLITALKLLTIAAALLAAFTGVHHAISLACPLPVVPAAVAALVAGQFGAVLAWGLGIGEES